MSALAVALIGGGRLAEVMAQLLAASKTPMRVTHWARRADVAESFAARHSHVVRSGSVAEAARDARIVILAVPAMALDEVAAAYGEVARGDQVVLHACRGVGEGFVLGHRLIRARTSVRKIVALGGPLHARELGTGRVLAAVAASRFTDGIEAVRLLTAGTPVRVHGSHDLTGVEVAGAMSNVWALASGMSDALELGDTARGLLLTHGLGEAQRLGMALGAEAGTFLGLAGLGDLVPRKVSSTERHHAHGGAVALGRAEGAPALEGLVTARAAHAFAHARRLRVPLLDAVMAALDGAQPAREALERVLQVDLDDMVLPGAR